MKEQHFLIDSKVLRKFTSAIESKPEDVLYLAGADNGQLASDLCQSSRLIVVEQDENIASYLDSLGLYRTMVIRSEPLLVLNDMPFDIILSIQPSLLSKEFLEALLRINFRKAVLIMPEILHTAFKSRTKLGILLRACFDITTPIRVPKSAYSPPLNEASCFAIITPSKNMDPVSKSLRLLIKEAGSMRGLLTRSCREYFNYTLKDAQTEVKHFDKALLKKRFYQLTDKEFKDIHKWLKLG